MRKTVLGCLPYLNVRPLIKTIEDDTPDNYELIYDTPAGLACRLRDASCDIAAVSSFMALESSDLVIVPGVSISSDGRVASVLLFSEVPFERIGRVALDTSSLSGAALTRILLHDLFGISPEFIHHAPDALKMLENADACLLIGNNAMVNAPSAPYVLDLGEGWRRLTGLPFVYGVWAGRKESVTGDDVALLQKAKNDGMGQLDAIVEAEHHKLGLPREAIRHYLTEIMIYSLGEREIAGLEEFGRRAVKMGLLPSNARVRLFTMNIDCAEPAGRH